MLTTKSKKKRSAKVARLTKKQRLFELVTFVQMCFVLLEESNLHQIADKTGLHISTIFRLAHGNISLRMHFGTIQALGYAAGVRLEASEDRITVRLVD